MTTSEPIRQRGRTAALIATLLFAPALHVHAQSATPARSAAPRQQASAGPAVQGVINLNTATLDELTRLPGVGPARAQAILDLRARLNGFKKIEDLMRVRGIGRKTFRKLAPMLRLSGATTLANAPAMHTAQR